MNDSSALDMSDEATVAAYLANRLDPKRAEAFEDYCLRHPDFARRVELELSLKVGLKQNQPSKMPRLMPRRWRTALAIAAAVVLVVGCGLLLLPHTSLGTLSAYRAASEVPAQLLAGPRVSATLIRLRGDAAVRRITAPAGAGVLLVRVAPDLPPGPAGYAIGLVVEPRVIPRAVTLDKLHPDEDGYIEMYLPMAEVAGHTLRVTVTPSPPGKSASLSFRLQINAQATPAD